MDNMLMDAENKRIEIRDFDTALALKWLLVAQLDDQEKSIKGLELLQATC